MKKKLTDLEWQQMYRRYMTNYEQQEFKMIRQGKFMDSPMYSFRQFTDAYMGTKEALRLEKELGERGSIGNVYQYMVREQAYPYSQKKIAGMRKAFKEVGFEDVKITRFSTYDDIKNQLTDEDWEKIKNTYYQLQVDGKSMSEARLMISHMFFGS